VKIKISIFVHPDKARAAFGISDEEWAKASHIRRPTISEMRRLEKNPGTEIGRACTYTKLSTLYDGLFKLRGGTELRKQLDDSLKSETDQEVRMILLIMELRNTSQSGKDLVENTIRMVIKTDGEPKK
jgi:hypothetical protein